jgi:alkanesulfonate monooxygenase SsuD/methylene tetrahydromethanopterin reductase-like flavin-dependent oxidoreductase (luciferase family)
MNELAFYTLAGQPNSPRELIDEVQQAEALGIGACLISERFDIKEAATLSGAVGAISREIGIATAATNHNTRHPVVIAPYAMTMHKLTGGAGGRSTRSCSTPSSPTRRPRAACAR